jgi:hypothetical protein
VSAAPLSVRVANGDIAAARATVIVVGHLNGLSPAGAEAAIDRALSGAITRRAKAGALDSHFGASHFIPANQAPLAADAVLVLGLGEPGKFDPRRLRELGAAIVAALVAVGARDAATVLHGSGSLGLPVGRAARELVEGFADARTELEGGDGVLELTLVEREEDGSRKRIDAARAALRELVRTGGSRVALERDTLRLGDPAGESVADRAAPEHLRIAINRAGEELKVTVISESAYDPADRGDYPLRDVVEMIETLESGVIREGDRRKRGACMRRLGGRMHKQFFAWPEFDLAAQLRRARDDYLVLRLDESTVDLPWELMMVGDQYLALSHLLARQREIVAPGHAAAFVPPHERLRALVVGDPTQDLAGAAREARAVGRELRDQGAEVRTLTGPVEQGAVLDELEGFDPDVLHYAGHASFDDVNQAAGGLVLADGVLTAAVLAAQPRLPRLFFANGCNSAQTGDVLDQMRAKAAATRDLAGGVLSAGARAFIGSQWEVDDEAATTFARELYRRVTRRSGSGETTIGAAVRLARRATIRSHGIEEKTWAGYALYGSPWASAL